MCAIFLHVILDSEIKQGFAMMKFANNHWWLFTNWIFAYLTGFFQMIIVVSLELINLALLATNDTILDVIMNFTALLILIEFDNILF